MTKKFQLGTTPKKSSKKTVVISLLCLLVLLVAASLFYWFVLRKDSPNSVDKNANDPTVQSAKEVDAAKTDPKTGTAPTNPSTISQDVPTSPSLTVSGIEFSQADGFVTASAQISGATQGGTCVFSYETLEGRPVVKQASGTTNCSVKISEVEFDKLGEWTLSVTFYNQNSKASSSRKVAIQ